MPGNVAYRVQIARSECAARLAGEIEKLSRPPFTAGAPGITRYAFTEPYLRTVEHLSGRLRELGFEVRLDAVGNLVARNCPPQVRAIGLGSHCDSVRGGGRFDGILGVLAAIEVARLSREHELDLPLQIVAWVEEEASGFGQMLLGSRIAGGQLDPRALREDVRSLDDGRTFFEHAREAGLRPEDASECGGAVDGLSAWLELHIEQARVLEDAGERIGVVHAIAGYVHADIEFVGQADHAGATPMGLRHDAAVAAAACVVELEGLAVETGDGAVATVGELEVEPGVINAVPGRARISLDIRAPGDREIDEIVTRIRRGATLLASRRGLRVSYRERQRVKPVKLDSRVADVAGAAAAMTGEAWRPMVSGAAHDTMCVAPHAPSAMVLVPCRGGISHSPDEFASADDAALGVEVVLNAAAELRD